MFTLSLARYYACDIALGDALDCNNNGVPDLCDEGADLFIWHGELQAPFEFGVSATWNIPAAGISDAPVSITAEAISDLSSSSERVEVYLDDVLLFEIFQGTAFDCSPSVATFSIPAATFNNAAAANGGYVPLRLEPVSGVTGCSRSSVVISVSAAIEPLTDCDANRLLDYCEILGDPGLDADGNGVLDSCEFVCLADLDANGMLNFDDIDTFVLFFLGSSLVVDFNGDGAVNLDDLDLFVQSFLAGCP